MGNQTMTIAVCGAGTMGRGIALSSIQSGIDCVLYDVQTEFVEKAAEFIEKQLSMLVGKQKMSAEEASNARARLRLTTDLNDFRSCQIVIEAIIENKQIKDSLFAQIESVVDKDAVIGSNTSSISIASLARSMKHPERFIGIHFFNPAQIMKLVELISGPHTNETTLKSAVNFVKSLSKSPAVAKDVPGFIVNRVARNYYNESQRIVMEGAAAIAQVDTVMKAHGFKMGPFELMDLIGVDVNLDVTKSMYQQYFYEPRFQPSLLQQQYMDAGLHGRKSGRGFYDYSDNK